MNPAEAITITRIVKGACPSQKMDEFTPDLWAVALRDIDFDTARQAIGRLVLKQPYIAISDIANEIKAHRRSEIEQRKSRNIILEIEGRERDVEASHKAYLDASRLLREAIGRKHANDEDETA